MNPPFIASALKEGAMLVAQYSTSTGFMLHLSWPMLEGIPSLQENNAGLDDAMMGLEKQVIAFQQANEELIGMSADAAITHDLFGNEVSIKFGDSVKKKHNDKPRGSAAPIGSGPQGETCKTCKHSYCRKMAGTYWKCDLVKATHGTSTDIRLKWAACSRFEKKE